MSAGNIRVQINRIRANMLKYDYYSELNVGTVTYEVTEKFLSDLNLLQQIYGEFVGKAKARHQEYLEELSLVDDGISECFAGLLKSSSSEVCFKLVNLAVGKISELISFVETLDTTPPEEKVSKEAFDKLAKEKEELRKTAEFLVRYKGLPELNTLIDSAKRIGLPVDEHWVLALCSSNLIEAVVNRKLEKLAEKAEGSFRARYQKLCKIIMEKERRDIQ
jgi:hypothetical protein